MARPHTSRMFKEAVSTAFRKLIKKGLSQATIARQLKVKRQAVHQWVKAETAPRPHILAAAMRLWDFKIVVDGHKFGQASFDVREGEASNRPLQLTLDNLLTQPAEVEIPGGRLTLRVVGRESQAIEVSVKLNLSA